MKTTELAKRLQTLQRTLSFYEGKRATLLARDAELVQKVGLAKGRVENKPARDAFLERRQADSMQHAVSRYSKLLTSLVQDIVPGDRNVGLELYTHAGLPALDIFTTIGNSKTRFDPVDQDSGAVTNCICLGLRAIATANSGLRKFLLLDEPDCWVEGDNIRAFYRMLNQLANQKNMQILVISHKSLNFFEAGANIIQVTQTDQGLRADVRAGARAWDSASTPGIRRITLRNVATYKDVTIPLSPGMNVIRGDNGSGKSRAGRNMRGVMYGGTEINDADIRLGEDRAESEYELEEGRVLLWSKQREKNPTWRLVDGEGEVVVLDGERCETVRQKAVPSWLAKPKAAGITRVLGLDIQLAHQKEPVFLLKEANTKRASVLSIGRESSWLQGMIACERENYARDREIIKTGEIELASVREFLRNLANVENLLENMQQAETTLLALTEEEENIEAKAKILKSLEASEASVRSTHQNLEILGKLPVPPDISAQLMRNTSIKQMGITIRKLEDCLILDRGLLNKLISLPEPPEQIETTDKRNSVKALEQYEKDLIGAKSEKAILEGLPRQSPVLEPLALCLQLANTIDKTTTNTKALKMQVKALMELPQQPPKLELLDNRAKSIGIMEEIDMAKKRAETERKETVGKFAAQALIVAELVAELGNVCPLCGSHVEHSHILEKSLSHE